MLGKLKSKVAEGKEKIAEKKAAHAEKQQNKWITEVTADESDRFKNFQAWKDLYEPVKAKKEGDGDSGPNAIQRKAMEKLANNITKNVVKMFMEAVSKLLDTAVATLGEREPALTLFLNAAQGIAMTYRFQYKNKKKFTYLRGVAIDRVAASLLGAIDSAAAAAGKDPKALDPAAVEEIVNLLVTKLVTEFENAKATALETIKASPLFAMSGVDGAQVDQGVAVLIGFIRGYVDDKFAKIIETARVIIAQLMTITLAARAQIEANIAANVGPEEQSEEYKNGVRAKLLTQVEDSYALLTTNVKNYVTGLLDLVQGLGGEEEAGEDA